MTRPGIGTVHVIMADFSIRKASYLDLKTKLHAELLGPREICLKIFTPRFIGKEVGEGGCLRVFDGQLGQSPYSVADLGGGVRGTCPPFAGINNILKNTVACFAVTVQF